MKRPFLVASLLLISTQHCLAEDNAPEAGVPDKARLERQEQVQVTLDRLVNKKPQFSMLGTIESKGGREYSINGEIFSTDAATKVTGRLKPGGQAEVRGFLVPGKPKVATHIVMMDQASEATETHEAPPDFSRVNPGQLR